MLKYTDTQVVFREVPDKIALAINISHCPNHCIGCHSPELRSNIGTELTDDELDRLIKENDGINCVCFMGEGRDIERLSHLIERVKKHHKIDTALYTGSDDFDETIFGDNLDYLKIGHYDEKYGSLDMETTNQRMYRLVNGVREDITSLFWRKI